MKNFMNWFMSEESGQGMVEYGLILALVAIAAIVVLNTMGDKLKGIFEKVNGSLETKAD